MPPNPHPAVCYLLQLASPAVITTQKAVLCPWRLAAPAFPSFRSRRANNFVAAVTGLHAVLDQAHQMQAVWPLHAHTRPRIGPEQRNRLSTASREQERPRNGPPAAALAVHHPQKRSCGLRPRPALLPDQQLGRDLASCGPTCSLPPSSVLPSEESFCFSSSFVSLPYLKRTVDPKRGTRGPRSTHQWCAPVASKKMRRLM